MITKTAILTIHDFDRTSHNPHNAMSSLSVLQEQHTTACISINLNICPYYQYYCYDSNTGTPTPQTRYLSCPQATATVSEASLSQNIYQTGDHSCKPDSKWQFCENNPQLSCRHLCKGQVAIDITGRTKKWPYALMDKRKCTHQLH